MPPRKSLVKTVPKANESRTTQRASRVPVRTTRSKRAATRDITPEEDSPNDDSDVYVDDGASILTRESSPDLDSDALDEDEESSGRKRKRASVSKKSSPKKARAPKKQRKANSDEEEWDDDELGDGVEVVGKVIQAPKTGRVAPGRISKNTLDFLAQLKRPECNDRQWFKLHEPVFRLAEKEWKDFIDKFTEDLVEVDTQIPPLPPKDVMHRIYRDVRFSPDKTPYKGSLPRFPEVDAKAYLQFITFKSGGQSLLAAGAWCPARNELQTIRNHIQRNSKRLRRILSAPRFIELFGEPKPGARRSIFGQEDELKVAPKGIDKNHKDIDLLKCRSFAVYHNFSDDEVLSPDFREHLIETIKVVQPLVHCLNDYITLPADDVADDDDNSDDEADSGQSSNEDPEA